MHYGHIAAPALRRWLRLGCPSPHWPPIRPGQSVPGMLATSKTFSIITQDKVRAKRPRRAEPTCSAWPAVAS